MNNFNIIKNKKKALEDFVIYQKRKKSQAIIILGTICGFLDENNKNYIYEALGNGTVSKEKTLIPEGYKKVNKNDKHFNDKWITRLYLQKYISPEQIEILNQEGSEIDKWIQKTRKYWLTIKDIEKLKVNKKIKLLVLDRNVYDCKDKFKRGKLYKPENFFKDNSAVFSKNTVVSLEGNIKYEWSEEPFSFEFEIEYKKNSWYPLKNGILPATDEQGFSELLGEDKSWIDFPKNTHIGWRGPMILWENLKKIEKVYYL